MPIVFDPVNRRIVLDSTAVSATEIYSRWVDWAATNLQYEPAFRQVGGDDLGGGLSIPPYYFLQSGWRVRPMEADHVLVITGNLFVEGGGVPVVPTIGSYNVATQYTVPVQAQGIATSGSSSPSASAIASEVRTALSAELLRIIELAKLHGLVEGVPLQVGPTTRVAGDVVQTITEAGGTTTVARSA